MSGCWWCARARFGAVEDVVRPLLFSVVFFLSTFLNLKTGYDTLNVTQQGILDKNFCWGIASNERALENHITADDDVSPT